MQLNCRISEISFKDKPGKREFGLINKSINHSTDRQVSMYEFADALKHGRTYLGGHLIDSSKGRSKGNVGNINFFSLDVDNDDSNYSIDEVIDKVYSLLNIKPFLVYETFSSELEGKNKRFRVLYGINGIADNTGLELLLKELVKDSGDMFDNSTSEIDRMFLATNKSVKIYNNYKLLDTAITDIYKVKAEEIEVKKEESKKRYILESDDSVEGLKQIDISDFLLDEGYTDIRKTKDGYEMPCPIHNGTKNNFKINYVENVYLWKCFSGCSGDGGTIIDLVMNLFNLEVGQAISYLKSKYTSTIGEHTRATGNVKSYKTTKYIKDTPETVESIMEDIRNINNHKIALFSPLGSGKTTLIKDELLKYARKNEAILITVTANVKQINYLENKQGFQAVHGTSRLDKKDIRDLIATTSESLPYVIDTIGDRPYMLVVDESQERITSRHYRNGYKGDNIEHEEERALKSIHMTATSEPLIADKYDVVIEIEATEMIENKIEILEMEKITTDNIANELHTSIEKGYQVLFHNDHKDDNELILNQLTSINHKLSTQHIFSGGEEFGNIEDGLITADITATTSAITSGIDLEMKSKGILYINLEKYPSLSNVYQIIGRVREGLEKVVLIVKKNNKDSIRYMNYVSKVNERIADSIKMKDILNSNYSISRLTKGKNSLSEIAHLERINHKWEINISNIVAEVYTEHSKVIIDDTRQLQEALEGQRAFKIDGTIAVRQFENTDDCTIEDIKKLKRKEKKELLEETVNKLLKLDDSILNPLGLGIYYGIEKEILDTFMIYKKLAPNDKRKLSLIKDKLIDKESFKRFDFAESFRKLHTADSWVSIEKEIKRVDTRERNRNIEHEGYEIYLKIHSSRGKKSDEVVQAIIRDEFKDIESKQGRITQSKVDKLTKKLINNNHLYNSKDIKTYKDENATEKDIKKAFNTIKGVVERLLSDIYNLTDDFRISSINK